MSALLLQRQFELPADVGAPPCRPASIPDSVWDEIDWLVEHDPATLERLLEQYGHGGLLQ